MSCGDRVRRDERQVDRQDHDRVGTAGDRVVARLAESRVQALAALAHRPRAEECRLLEAPRGPG